MASAQVEGNGVVGGVDTHQDQHTVAVVSIDGAELGTESFPTTGDGYRAMLAWLRSHGELLRVGVECTGTYGAGVSRCLAAAGVPVLEVIGPDPVARKAQGKDDALDAIAAAQAARIGYRTHVAKDRTGAVEALRTLCVARRSAVKGCIAAQQQLHHLIVSAPERLRDELRDLPRMKRLRKCAAWRPRAERAHEPEVATKIALKRLARRVLAFKDEIAGLDECIRPIVEGAVPALLELEGVGLEGVGLATAADLLVAVGENPDRMRSEGSFAMMCGVSPIPAPSGKTRRHRLNRGGNRSANSALHLIVLTRMRTDPRTRRYVERRTEEGLSKREVMRCLERYMARRVYRALTNGVGAAVPTESSDAASAAVAEARETAAGSQGERRDRAGVRRSPAAGLSDPGERGRRSADGVASDRQPARSGARCGPADPESRPRRSDRPPRHASDRRAVETPAPCRADRTGCPGCPADRAGPGPTATRAQSSRIRSHVLAIRCTRRG